MENHPIRTVVEPLKEDAIQKASSFASERVENIYSLLAEADWDLNVVAPAPNSRTDGSDKYKSKKAYRNAIRSLVKKDEERNKEANGSYYTNSRTGVYYVTADSQLRDRFIEMAKENAAIQYEAYIVKLINKVGPCVHAELEGNHVWGESFLTCTSPEGKVTCWKTQTIINYSKLGKVFNQFPTRKIKV